MNDPIRPPPVLPPEECQDMSQVRAGVDAVDRALVELFETRFAYMRAAARIKQSRDDVRDEARKAQVVAAVHAQAAQGNMPADAIARLWEELVELSISYEAGEWERLRES